MKELVTELTHSLKYLNLCFADFLHDNSSETKKVGAAFRWCIDAQDDKGLELCLQTLPSPVSTLEGRPAFRCDTCPGVTLKRWPIIVNMADGPRPTLCCKDQAKLIETLMCTPGAIGQTFLGEPFTIIKQK